MLELKNIISVDWNSDRTEILVTLEGNIPITIDEGGNIARLERTFLRYNQNIGSNGRPIAYDTERNLILPSTVSMSVELVGNPESDNPIIVFGPPRPGQMYLSRDLPHFAHLLRLLRQIVQEDMGAIFALRRGFWIEDIRLINPEDTLRMNGMVIME